MKQELNKTQVITNFKQYCDTFIDSGFNYTVAMDSYNNTRFAILYIPEQQTVMVYQYLLGKLSNTELEELAVPDWQRDDLQLTAAYDLKNHILHLDVPNSEHLQNFVQYMEQVVYCAMTENYKTAPSHCRFQAIIDTVTEHYDTDEFADKCWELTVV